MDALISYEDAAGLPPAPPAESAASAAAPAPIAAAPTAAAPVSSASPAPAPSDDGEAAPAEDRVLTVSPRRPTPAAKPTPAMPALISYEDATAPDTSHPDGILSNAPDDGYLSGALKGLGTAAVKAVGDVVGFPTALHGLVDYLVARGEAKITGKPVDGVLADMAQKKAALPAWLRATDPANLIPAPAAISGAILAHTGEYVPTTEPGRIAQGAAEAALSSIGPGMGAASGTAREILQAAPKLALGNAVAGGAGQAATDVTGDPLYGLAAGLVVPPLAEKAAAAAAPIIMGTPIVNRLPGVAGSRERAAGAKLLGAASDPAALRDFAANPPATDPLGSLPDAADGMAPLAVSPGEADASAAAAGTPQTLAGSVAFDPGLAAAEKMARGVDPAPFAAVDQARGAAGRAALTKNDGGADVLRPGRIIAGRLDALDTAAAQAEAQLTAAHQAAVADRAAGQQQSQDRLAQAFQDAHARAQQAADDASAPLRVLPPADARGETLRTAIEAAHDAADAEKGRLYDQVPDDATIVTAPIADAKRDLLAGIDPLTGVQPTGPEAALHAAIDRLPPVVPFRSVRTLDSRVTAAMREARIRPDPNDPQAHGRLVQLKGAVLGAIENAADNHAAFEQRLVDQQMMPRELTLENRLRDFAGVEQAQPVGGQATGTYGGPTFFPGGRGGGSQAAPSMPAAPSRPAPIGGAPQSLVGFLKQAGGIREFGGELAARDMARQFPGLVNNRDGLPLDRAREMAAEAGYLGHDTTAAVSNTDVNDLLSALDNHPVYSVHDQDRILARDDARTVRELSRAYKANAGEIRQGLAAAGVDPRGISPEVIHDAAALMEHERQPWHDAFEQVRNDRLADLQDAAREGQSRAAQEQGYNDPADADARERSAEAGGAAGAGGDVGGTGEGRRAPTFDEAWARDLAAAKAAHADLARTFRNPTIAPVLADNGHARQFTMPAGAVPGRAVVVGPKGYETAQRFLAATGGAPAAVQAMAETALAGLRKAMPPTGTLHPQALARWRSPEQFGGALRALDEVRPGFSSSMDDAATATQAVLDLGLRQRDEMQAAQRQAAAEAIAANRRSAETMRAGIAQARGIAGDARATPAGQYAGKVGAAIAPAEVENAVGAMLKTGTGGARRMRSLVGSVASDPEALAGMRKAGTDWMVRSFDDGAGGLDGSALVSFVGANRDTLKELYPPAQVAMMGAVARFAEAGAAWQRAKASGVPSAIGKTLQQAGHMSLLMVAMEGLEKGYEIGGTRGALVAAATPAAYLIKTLRSAGIHSVDALYREALADPEKARYLISKMPATANGGKLLALSGVLRRELVVGTQEIEARRKAAGR